MCIGEDAVYDQYYEVYQQALEEDITLLKDEAKLELFRTIFLTILEAGEEIDNCLKVEEKHYAELRQAVYKHYNLRPLRPD